MAKREVETAEVYTDREGKSYPVRVSSEEEPPRLVTFGLGATSVYRDGSSTSGYANPESFFKPSRWWTHDYATRPDLAQYEGCPFVDMRAAAQTDSGVRMSINGPMVDVKLRDGEREDAPEPSEPMFGAMLAGGGTFGGLLALQAASREKGQEYGPLDSCPVSVYLRMWKEAGAVVGTIRGGEFVSE